MSRPARHCFEAHTGEVLLRVHAASLPELLVETAWAVAELLADEPNAVALGAPERVAVEATDRAALLVAWIDEIVFLTEKTGCVFPVVEIVSASERRIVAIVRGGPPATWRTAVKAATWHRLAVIDEPEGGVSATVVLDV